MTSSLLVFLSLACRCRSFWFLITYKPLQPCLWQFLFISSFINFIFSLSWSYTHATFLILVLLILLLVFPLIILIYFFSLFLYTVLFFSLNLFLFLFFNLFFYYNWYFLFFILIWTNHHHSRIHSTFSYKINSLPIDYSANFSSSFT